MIGYTHSYMKLTRGAYMTRNGRNYYAPPTIRKLVQSNNDYFGVGSNNSQQVKGAKFIKDNSGTERLYILRTSHIEIFNPATSARTSSGYAKIKTFSLPGGIAYAGILDDEENKRVGIYRLSDANIIWYSYGADADNPTVHTGDDIHLPLYSSSVADLAYNARGQKIYGSFSNTNIVRVHYTGEGLRVFPEFHRTNNILKESFVPFPLNEDFLYFTNRAARTAYRNLHQASISVPAKYEWTTVAEGFWVISISMIWTRYKFI